MVDPHGSAIVIHDMLTGQKITVPLYDLIVIRMKKNQFAFRFLLLQFGIGLLLFPFSAQGQSADSLPVVAAPDNEAIELAIIDPQSPFYYPNLMMRYKIGDSTLTFADYRHLYYGYAFQPEYRPLETIAYADSVNMVLVAVKDEEFSPDQLKRIIGYSEKVLTVSPFSMKHLNLLAFAYHTLGNDKKAAEYSLKTHMVMVTVQSSGTGLKEDLPWHVLFREDQTDILSSMNLRASRRIVISTTVEYLSLLVRNGDIKGYYFDISRLYWKKPEQTDLRKRGFEINSTKNPRSNQFIRPVTY